MPVKAHRLRMNVSETPKGCLRSVARAERQRLWLENQEAIEAYNQRVAQDGILSDEVGLQ